MAIIHISIKYVNIYTMIQDLCISVHKVEGKQSKANHENLRQSFFKKLKCLAIKMFDCIRYIGINVIIVI